MQKDQLPEVLQGLQQWWVLHNADIIVPVSALILICIYAACVLRQAVIMSYDAYKGLSMHRRIILCNHLLLMFARQGTAGHSVQAIILSTSTG